MSCQISSSIFGGIGISSGVRRASSPLRRLAQLRFEAADAEPGQSRLHAVDDPGALADQAFPLTARTPGILLRERRDRDHPAVPAFAAQPTQEHAHEQRRVQPVGSPGGARVTRRRRRMDDVPRCREFAATAPAKPVAPRLKGEGNPLDRPGPPSPPRPASVPAAGATPPDWPLLLQWLAIKAGNQSGHQPASLTQLNDHRQSGILIKGGEGTAQVTNLAHGAHPSVSCNDDAAMPCPRRSPA